MMMKKNQSVGWVVMGYRSLLLFFGCVVRFLLSSWTEGEIECRENVSKQRKNEFDGLLVVFTFFEWCYESLVSLFDVGMKA